MDISQALSVSKGPPQYKYQAIEMTQAFDCNDTDPALPDHLKNIIPQILKRNGWFSPLLARSAIGPGTSKFPTGRLRFLAFYENINEEERSTATIVPEPFQGNAGLLGVEEEDGDPEETPTDSI